MNLMYRRGVSRGKMLMLEKLLLFGAAALLGYIAREAQG